jgi:hypothetical protein
MTVYLTIRPITVSECSWLPHDIPTGTTLYKSWQASYGVCTPKGVMVCFLPHSMRKEQAALEVPKAALKLKAESISPHGEF